MSWKDRWGWLIPRAPERRMYRRCVVPMILLFISLFVSLSFLDEIASLPLRAAVVLSPLIFYFWLFRIYFAYLGECDELERRIELESIAIAAMLTLFFLMGAMFLFAAAALPTGFAVPDALAITGLILVFGYMFVRYYLLWKNW